MGILDEYLKDKETNKESYGDFVNDPSLSKEEID